MAGAHGGISSSGIPKEDTSLSGTVYTQRARKVSLGNPEDETDAHREEPPKSAAPSSTTTNRELEILHNLPIWNKVLYHVQIEVREVPQTATELTLTSKYFTSEKDPDPQTLQSVARLLHYLMNERHYVMNLDVIIGKGDSHDAFLCDALTSNDRIASLRFHIWNGGASHSFFSVIPNMKNLRHIEAVAGVCSEPLLEALSFFLPSSKALETLCIANVRTRQMDTTELLNALTKCRSLRNLSLNCSILESASRDSCSKFTTYVRHSSTLTTLKIQGHCRAAGTEKIIMRGLQGNRSIREFEMQEMRVDGETGELVADVIAQNTALRCFSPGWDYVTHLQEEVCDGWIPALIKNENLERLSLHSCVWRFQKWRQFLGALPSMCRLQVVNIHWLGALGTSLHTFCETLRVTGADEKVTFKGIIDPFLCKGDLCAVKCKSFLDVYCCAYKSVDVAQLQRLMRTLSLCNHVTSLTVMVEERLWSDVSSGIADYIGTATALKKLRVNILPKVFLSDDTNKRWKATVESISRNQSITELYLEVNVMKTEEAENLGDVIRLSENIRSVFVWLLGRQLMDHFLKRLSKDIASNYSLVSAEFPVHFSREALAVLDAARRNSSLVAGACRFQQGAALDRLTAGALERVYRHRALLEEFANVASISVEEAVSSAKAAFRTFEDLHAFMRMAGVVRVSVVCHAREDGRAQLDDLTEYCWRALRRYLMLDDVVTCPSKTRQP